MNAKTIQKIVLSLFIVLIIGSLASSAAIQFTDTEGKDITLPAVAEKLVCLNSDSAEMLIALGAGDKVVGLTNTGMNDSVIKPLLPKAVSVGDWQTPSVERVLSLKPDAVITYSSSKPKNADQFATAGIRLIYLDCYKIDTLEHDARAMGILTGKEAAAETYLSWMKKWSDLVRSKVADIPADKVPRVYAEGYSDFSAQGKNSGTDMLLTRVKGENIASGLEGMWPKVTPEWVVKENPSVIVKIVATPTEKNPLSASRDAILKRPGFENLEAVKNNKVYAFCGDLTLGPRCPAGLVYLAKVLHPEEMKDVNPSDAIDEFDKQFVSGTKSGDYLASGN